MTTSAEKHEQYIRDSLDDQEMLLDAGNDSYNLIVIYDIKNLAIQEIRKVKLVQDPKTGKFEIGFNQDLTLKSNAITLKIALDNFMIKSEINLVGNDKGFFFERFYTSKKGTQALNQIRQDKESLVRVMMGTNKLKQMGITPEEFMEMPKLMQEYVLRDNDEDIQTPKIDSE